MKRIPPPIWLFIAIASMTVLHVTVPIRELAPTPFNLIGVVFVIAGLLLFGMSVRRFIRAHTTVIPFRESTALITTGIFRFSRNPIYLSMVLVLLGVALLFGSMTPFLVVIAFTIMIDRVFIAGEELMLRKTFSADYEKYCCMVRRWI